MEIKTSAPDFPILSIVITFRNEEEVLPVLLEQLEKVLTAMQVTYEVIFVDDVSTDGSSRFLNQKAEKDCRIKVITMVRRYGVSDCLWAGMSRALGSAVITMDADLQDPPEVLPELLSKWHSGADVVYTVRLSRAGEPAFKIGLTRLAYQVLRWASDKTDLIVESGDFRLLSRRALKALLNTQEREPYLRGLVRTLPLRQEAVPYHRRQRLKGESHFPVLSKGPILTFLSGLFSFSSLPRKLAYALAALFMAGTITALCLWKDAPPEGVLAVTFLSQILAFCILAFYDYRRYSKRSLFPQFTILATKNRNSDF